MTHNHKDKWRLLIIWEFTVRPGTEKIFEETYGPEGDWAHLFQQSNEYLGMELVRDSDQARRYLTLDFWTSEEEYDKFRSQHAAEYKAIDQKCESMTEHEREIGRYLRTGN